MLFGPLQRGFLTFYLLTIIVIPFTDFFFIQQKYGNPGRVTAFSTYDKIPEPLSFRGYLVC
ncbi:MAG TPA: hypothetical protein DEQ06_02195 [Porphyromonadaceae bacterium]|nr:hypothetical protein [Porphyromonadaceae bacterium]